MSSRKCSRTPPRTPAPGDRGRSSATRITRCSPRRATRRGGAPRSSCGTPAIRSTTPPPTRSTRCRRSSCDAPPPPARCSRRCWRAMELTRARCARTRSRDGARARPRRPRRWRAGIATSRTARGRGGSSSTSRPAAPRCARSSTMARRRGRDRARAAPSPVAGRGRSTSARCWPRSTPTPAPRSRPRSRPTSAPTRWRRTWRCGPTWSRAATRRSSEAAVAARLWSALLATGWIEGTDGER